jgi:hypothetical protein
MIFISIIDSLIVIYYIRKKLKEKLYKVKPIQPAFENSYIIFIFFNTFNITKFTMINS